MISVEEYAGKRAHVLRSLPGTGATEPLALAKSSSNLFRHRAQKRVHQLDLRAFNHVLHINEQERYAEVEGLTTYEELVRETLVFNLMPAVVPQLKTITIGGAIAGIGIESSSFKYGFVHETMQELEVLFPDGEVVVATRENEHRDLFFGFPNSYGTLGYALRVKIALIPVKPFVKLTHHKYTDLESCFQAMARLCKDGTVDFVDGTMFHGQELYITTGQFVDRAEWLSDYTYLQIYYQSIPSRTTDYLTIHDYIWRWDTDWFWCSKHFLLQYPLMRRMWGKERLRSSVYWKLWKRFNASPVTNLMARAIEGRQESVIQDVEVPIEQAPRFAQFFNEQIGIKPVWICPVAPFDPSAAYALYPMSPQKLYVNFGFWDSVKTTHDDGHFNKMIEAKVSELGGHKSLYSSSYYSKEEFGRLYSASEYLRLKTRYDSKGKLKHLYEKCVLKQ
ncbi:MAG: FAD-binding oxidoreductase [Nitrospiraceae bacterium]|jgi:FAD/FMN-containing dehydrogenase|nr:FAD-binding oxidoreductase [Nitrospiraceae bacterium]